MRLSFRKPSSCTCGRTGDSRRARRAHIPFRTPARSWHRVTQSRASQDPPPEGNPPKPEDPNIATAQKLPGADNDKLQIPKEVIERLRYSVFGIDTLWVTEVDNYEQDGVIFKGNFRGKDPAATYKKMTDRLKDVVGDQYQLYLLRDMDDKPTAVLMPSDRLQLSSENARGIRRLGEVWVSVLFAVTTVFTTLQSSGAPLIDFVLDPSKSPPTLGDIQGAVPGALIFWSLLGAHDLAHLLAAQRTGVKQTWPFLVPGGFGLLGSFGSLTQFKSVVPNRPTLLEISAAGPAAGAALSLVVMLAGFALTANGQGDVGIDTPAFADSALVAVLAQLFIPDQLSQPEILVHPALLAGWAGLFINALHCMPIGDLDGGRISHAVLGRRTASQMSAISLIALGIASFFNTLAFYWVLLVLALARGPILPQAEEFTEPQDVRWKSLGLGLLALPLLVLPPFPIELAVALSQMQSPAPLL